MIDAQLYQEEQEELFVTEEESEQDISEEYMEEVPQTQEMLKEIVNGLLQADLPIDEEPVEELEEVKAEEHSDELLNQATKKMEFSQEYGYEQEAREDEEEIPTKNYARFLTPEQKSIFSYFVAVPGMEKQICQAMEEVNRKEDKTSSCLTPLSIMIGSLYVLLLMLIYSFEYCTFDKSSPLNQIQTYILLEFSARY